LNCLVSRGCDIPSVTIEGTVQDWQSISSKLDRLRGFELEWWVNELKPIIAQIIQAKSGAFNRDFWMGMVRYNHAVPGVEYDSQGNWIGSQRPSTITGWITNFFPYDKSGQRLGGAVESSSELPSEMLNVPFTIADSSHPSTGTAADCR
jgi:hypothetical protein